MGEWKRVFLNPGRIGLTLLLTLLLLALFAGSLMQRVGPGELNRALEMGRYKGELTEKWKDEDPSEIVRLSEEEEALLMDYYYFLYGYERWDSEGNVLPPAFSSREEADYAISDMTYLLSLRDDELMFSETLFMYVDALHEVQKDAEYIAGYTDYLLKIQKQTEDQSKTSIFGKKNSFSMRNLKKTAEEFGKLLGKDGKHAVPVSFGNNTGIEKWLQFTLGDYFGLLLIIVFVMAFLEERKKGLWSIIRTTEGGRRKLGFARAGILLAVSALSAALFNMLPLLLSVHLNGGHTDLSRAIQSVQSFRTCTIRTDIRGWLIQYFIVKTFSGLFLGLFIWFVMGSVQNAQLSLAALLPVLGGEYALFSFLPVQSFLNLFKYLNLFSCVHTSRLYTNYLNINIFSFPVGNRRMMMLLLPILLALFIFLTVWMQARRYPEGNRDILSGIALRLNALFDRFRRRFTAGMWEGYKVLFLEYGIVIMVIIAIASKSLSFSVWAPIPESKRVYYMYVKDVQGSISEETDEYILRARENAEKSANPWELQNALDMLEERISELRKQGGREHFDPWILYDRDFDAYYGKTPENRQRLNAMIAMLFVIFLTAGISSYEKQSGVVPMLRSLKNGRRKLLFRKILIALLLTVFSWGFVYLREMLQFISRYGSGMLPASLKSIPDFAAFPLNLTVRGYLVLLEGTRLLMLFSVAFSSLLISSYLPNVRVSYLAGTAVLVLPALFTVLGIGVFRFVSPLIPVSAAELYLKAGSGQRLCFLPFVIWLLIGHAALMVWLRKWNRN